MQCLKLIGCDNHDYPFVNVFIYLFVDGLIKKYKNKLFIFVLYDHFYELSFMWEYTNEK